MGANHGVTSVKHASVDLTPNHYGPSSSGSCAFPYLTALGVSAFPNGTAGVGKQERSSPQASETAQGVLG